MTTLPTTLTDAARAMVAPAFVSGPILYGETLHQSTAAGVPFVRVTDEAGILPGIEVDTGTSRSAPRPARRSPKDSTGSHSVSTRTAPPARASRSGAADGRRTLTQRNTRIPDEACEFAINASNERFWEPPVHDAGQDLVFDTPLFNARSLFRFPS